MKVMLNIIEYYLLSLYQRTAAQPTASAKVMKSQPGPEKTTRVIVLPSEEKKSDNPAARSRRLLEAAGCYGAVAGMK